MARNPINPPPLTPKERLIIYKKLLKVVCEDPDLCFGMCWYLTITFNFRDDNTNIPCWWRYLHGPEQIQHLPELYKYRPSYGPLYWAPLTTKGWETRIGWIEQAIKNVKKQIK